MNTINTVIYGFFIILILALATQTHAQTTYKNDPGYFGSIESLYFRGGSFEDAQLIGPAFGYRFNKNFDISLHTELLFSEVKFNSRANGHTSLLNLGIILGRNDRFTKQFMLRSEASFYKSFNFNVEGFPEVPNPSLNSAQGSSSFYARLPLSNSISLLPNMGGFLGYGEYDAPVTDAELTQGYDGFVAGPQFGLDALFKFSDSFFMTVQPSYRSYFTSENDLDGEFNVNFRFNF